MFHIESEYVTDLQHFCFQSIASNMSSVKWYASAALDNKTLKFTHYGVAVDLLFFFLSIKIYNLIIIIVS